MKKYLGILFIASFMLMATVALAKDGVSGSDDIDGDRSLLDFKMRSENEDRDMMKDSRGPGPSLLKQEMMDGKENIIAGMQESREAFREKIEAAREDLKDGTITADEFRKEVQAQHAEFSAELKTKLEAFKAEVKAKKEEFKKSSEDIKAKFRENAQNMIDQRFESAFTNLERMQARVQALIDQLKADGKDTSQAATYLKTSEDKLAEAKAKLADVKKLLPTDGTDVSADVFEQIKVGARETKDILKESHASLVDAVKEIRGLGAGEKDSDQDGDTDQNETQ